MIKPCPNCNKPVIVSFDLSDAMNSCGKQLVCSNCGDILWLDNNGILKSVSKEYREKKQRELEALSAKKENCAMIICGKETPSEKEYYVRGVGQLCKDCHTQYYLQGGDRND